MLNTGGPEVRGGRGHRSQAAVALDGHRWCRSLRHHRPSQSGARGVPGGHEGVLGPRWQIESLKVFDQIQLSDFFCKVSFLMKFRIGVQS